ncbi:MAG: hypothetical protein J0L84_12950 [Verrucomicrobia bacterium]|nr:hypothetical protein [Verrucomicrobiota bacterium]
MKTVPPYCVENWIEMKRGDTLQFDALWSQENGDPVDLTGYTAKMQVRPQTADGAPILDLSTGGNGITLGGAAGTIAVTASAATTRTLTPGEYVYDLELTSPTGVVTTIVAGQFTLFMDVTRPA